jgi:trehalose synthase
VQQVRVPEVPLERFEAVLEPETYRDFRRKMEEAAERFRGRTLWCVNSTATGGGVAEILRPALAYLRGTGIDARWLVIEVDERFFELTKRLHNMLHGDPGDEAGLGRDDRTTYERCLEPSATELARTVVPGDVVVVHDPQPAGLIPAVRSAGGVSIWRCHVGVDEPNDVVRAAREFLRPYVDQADAAVFSREAFVWPDLGDTEVIPPSIDPFSPKNQHLEPEAVGSILAATGLQKGDDEAEPTFPRADGRLGRVERRATVVEDEPVSPTTPIVTQISRWDRLKDPMGVLRGFVRHVSPDTGAHLVLAGPAVDGVVDDPEQGKVANEVKRALALLPRDQRVRIHLAFLPTEEDDENAAIVNALQRRSDVVVQKSLAEGFGLTVAEAMWKERPVVASAVGGITDQIEDGRSGRLIPDACDLAAFGDAIEELLRDPSTASAMGRAAHRRVLDRFLPTRHLHQWVDLVGRQLAAERAAKAG